MADNASQERQNAKPASKARAQNQRQNQAQPGSEPHGLSGICVQT